MPSKITLKTGEVFDTTVLLPHIECYHIIDNKLYGENIYTGRLILIGEIDNS